jgi:hypothetical protein
VDPLKRLDKGIGAAHDALRRKGKARYRLKDILVEEVSLVDSAANKRKFLIVKRAPDGGAMAKPATKPSDTDSGNPDSGSPSVDDANKGDTMSIPKVVKAEVARELAVMLERLVGVAETVKNADPSEEELDAPLPAALGEELVQLHSELGEMIQQYPSPAPAAKSAASKVLDEISLVTSALAKQVAGEEELSTDVIARLQQLGVMFSSLTKGTQDDGGASGDADNDPKEDDVTQTNKRRKISAESLEKLEDMDKKLRALAKETKALLGELAGVTKNDDDTDSGNPPDPTPKSAIDALTEQVASMATSIQSFIESHASGGGAGDPPPADPPAGDPPPVDPPAGDPPPADSSVDAEKMSKMLAETQKQVKELQAQLAKALEDPPARASTDVTKNNDDDSGEVTFPLYYNHNTYDPKPAS